MFMCPTKIKKNNRLQYKTIDLQQGKIRPAKRNYLLNNAVKNLNVNMIKMGQDTPARIDLGR